MKKFAVLALAAFAALAACTPYYPPYPPAPPPPPSYPYPPAPYPPPPPPMTPRPPMAGPGQACGGFAGVQCGDPRTFCEYAPQAQCGAADRPGVCVARPEVCTREYAPVCGCDGRTYGNRCEAAGAEVSVLRPGACF